VDLTLVTVTRGQRPEMIVEMYGSVAGQTVAPAAHLTVFDDGAGYAATVTRAVRMVETGWFCLVDDDDLLLPNHVELLAGNLSADVVWTWCEVRGRRWSPNEPYQPGVLQGRNYIPANHACSTDLFRFLDGYRDAEHPDHDFLARAEQSGATFLNVPTITWVYRFHGGNMSW
jgi:hypothetical protein